MRYAAPLEQVFMGLFKKVLCVSSGRGVWWIFLWFEKSFSSMSSCDGCFKWNPRLLVIDVEIFFIFEVFSPLGVNNNTWLLKRDYFVHILLQVLWFWRNIIIILFIWWTIYIFYIHFIDQKSVVTQYLTFCELFVKLLIIVVLLNSLLP